jgi:hypothetical protein
MYADVTTETTAIAHTGRGTTLPPGRYEVAHLDGVDENSVLYIHGPNNGALMCVDRHDPNISFEEFA